MTKLCAKCGCVVDDESQDLCFACLIEDLDEKKPGSEDSQLSVEVPYEKAKSNQNWLPILLEIFAIFELIAGIVFAFAGGITDNGYHTDFNGFIFFGCLIGGIIGFVALSALSVFVKAANKYLNEK